MPEGSNSFRVNCCRSLGAKVIFAKNSTDAFNLANDISESEKREFIHPFEGKDVISGTATLGLEIFNVCEDMEAILIPIGGGGLAAGVSHAIKQSNKNIQVFGVEPENANTMQISIKKNKVQSDMKINTIADSLAAPFSLPLSFDYCLNNLDQVVTVRDSQMRDSIQLICNQMNLAVEPACSITTAALLDPLRSKLNGKKIVLIMCGSNLNWSTYKNLYK
jgi:threonine dehydratase